MEMGNCFSGDKKKSWGLQRDEHTNVSFNPYQTNTELEGVFSSYDDRISPESARNTQMSRVDQTTADNIYVALYDYDSRTTDELSVRAWDNLKVLEIYNEYWWKARHLKTGTEGYIPANYIALLQSIESEPWYFGKIRRADAEKLLFSAKNKNGSFLVRDSESHSNEYSLSMAVIGPKRYREVKHYRVQQHKDTNGEVGYSIDNQTSFRTVRQLVEQYRISRNGLPTELTHPCIKIHAPVTATLSYDVDKCWEISRCSLKLIREIGTGTFGQVHEGLWNNKMPVAIKSLKPGTMDVKDFLEEAIIMQKLQHPHLIRLYAVCTKEEPIYIITELMKNGSLSNYLKGKGSHTKFTSLMDMASQVASAMEYLESKNFIHRDLAARNVLVGYKRIVKVADFGLARCINEEIYEARVGSRFPLKWTAPEAFGYNQFSTKSDVWSFGILLAEIVTYGQPPYAGMSNNEVIRKIEYENYRMPKPSNCPHELYNIMLLTWNTDPLKRPTFAAIQQMLEPLRFEKDAQNYREVRYSELES